MDDNEGIDRILIATDGSPGSLVAAEEGVRLAKALGANVTFVAVAHAPLPVLGEPYYQRALSEISARCGPRSPRRLPMPRNGTSSTRQSCSRDRPQR